MKEIIQYSFELMQLAPTLSPCNVIIRPAISSTPSYTASHVMWLFPKRSMDLDAASLDVESSSIAIDDTNGAWSPIDSVWRKRTPVDNNPKQSVVNVAGTCIRKMSFHMRNYQPSY